MALRRQLLLLASLTLVLPWAGCEYVREMEAGLREGQQAALGATAQAVEARLRTDPEILAQLSQSLEGLQRFEAEPVLYIHSLQGSVVVDGYGEEWRNFAIPPQQIPGTAPPVSISLGERGGSIYAFIEVADSERQFFDPSQPLQQADHVLMRLGDGTLLRLFSAAPGAITVERHLGQGAWQREHRVTGIWNEAEDSYVLELRLPRNLATGGLAVQANDGASDEEVPALLPLHPLLRGDKTYTDALAIFTRPGVRLALVAQDGWLLGRAGELSMPRDDEAVRDTLAHHLVRRVLGRPDYPVLPAEEPGRLTHMDTTTGSSWYRWSDSLVGRVTMPISLAEDEDNSAPALALVAEQSLDSLQTLTTGAMGRLLWYTTLATLLAGGTLLAYASVLSWRIRRLSKAAQRAVDSEGRIRAEIPGSRSKDEIGDLARSYAALLQRLRHYNEYLETLASKLSHELRTPLAIVRSSLDNLGELQPTEQQQVYLERASEGATRLTRLLNAMSAAARLEHSIAQNERERVDMAEFLALLVESYRSVYAPRNLTLTCVGEGPFVMSASPELLAQMCDKLVENAADFTGESGSVELVLTRELQEVRLQVINTGPLIPDALQGRLFDSLTSGRSGQGHHLGLGLYVVRLIVDFHKGRVQAFNHPGGDKVVFEVRLPVDP
jgi:two-component system sensor histidine kinase ChvG